MSKLAPESYVPLDRRFERAHAADTDEMWAEVLSDRKTARDWNWLRSQSRVIALLAQAGSGKTVEFQNQVDESRAFGRSAFFFRIERLCSVPFHEAHETADCQQLFDQWLQGASAADLFLDAVDEAKLPQSRTARPLRDALRKLEAALTSNLERVSVFVSCRSSEWFDDIEQKAMEDLASTLGAATLGSEPVKVFNAAFSALDIGRVRRLAEGHGGDAAISALVESEAIADIVTPLDAILHLETFSAFAGTPELAARFASRGKLLETSVRSRLLELGGDVRRTQLEFTAGLRAAQFLAFASTVAQTMDFSIGGPRQGCVDPHELAPVHYSDTDSR